MPATYTLRADTNFTVEGAVSYVGKLPRFRLVNGQLSAPGLTSVDVYSENQFGQKMIQSAFGFIPQIAISMIPDKFDLFDQGLDSVTELLNAWLKDQQGDLVLLLNQELVIASRVRGQVILNETSSFWSQD